MSMAAQNAHVPGEQQHARLASKRARPAPGTAGRYASFPRSRDNSPMARLNRPVAPAHDAADIKRRRAKAVAGIIGQPDFRGSEHGGFAIRARRWQSRHEYG